MINNVLSDLPFSRIFNKDGRDVTNERIPVSVLGIDAAWKPNNPSGVALIHKRPEEKWEFVALAPSYDSFIKIADSIPVPWDQTPKDGVLNPELLVESAMNILGGLPVSVISADLPTSKSQIYGRREADNAISRKFGAKGCGTHSPIPGNLLETSRQMQEFIEGPLFKLAINNADTPTIHSGMVIETYPHPALLCLLQLDYRCPYKVGNSLRYYPGTTIEQRGNFILQTFRCIKEGLDGEIQGIPDFLPPSFIGPLNHLKRYEDALDALICAWVGARYIEGGATPYGDDTAAIWIPHGRSSPLSS